MLMAHVDNYSVHSEPINSSVIFTWVSSLSPNIQWKPFRRLIDSQYHVKGFT